MTARQKEIINDNLRAFINNFGSVRIEKEECGRGWYVFYPADSDSYIQFCYNIDYLNGWLYGVVQGVNRFPKNKPMTDYKTIVEDKGVFKHE